MPPVKYDPNNALRKQGQTEAPANPVNVNVRNRNFNAEPSGTNWAELSRNVQGIVPEEPVYEEPEPEVIEEQSQEENRKEEKKPDATSITEANPLATAEPVVKEEEKKEEPIPAPTPVVTNTGTPVKANLAQAPREDETEFYKGSTDRENDDQWLKDFNDRYIGIRNLPDMTFESAREDARRYADQRKADRENNPNPVATPVNNASPRYNEDIAQRIDGINIPSRSRANPSPITFRNPVAAENYVSTSQSGTNRNYSEQGSTLGEIANWSWNLGKGLWNVGSEIGDIYNSNIQDIYNKYGATGAYLFQTDPVGFLTTVGTANLLNIPNPLEQNNKGNNPDIIGRMSDAEKASDLVYSGMSREDAIQKVNADRLQQENSSTPPDSVSATPSVSVPYDAQRDPYERSLNAGLDMPMRLPYNTPITAERRNALRRNAESNNPVSQENYVETTAFPGVTIEGHNGLYEYESDISAAAQQQAQRREALRENASRNPVNSESGLYEYEADIDAAAEQRAEQLYDTAQASDPYERALNAEYANAAMRDPYERDVDINNVPQNPVNRPDPYERDTYAAYRNANASDPYERDVNLPMRLQYNTPITAERRNALRKNAESNNPVNPNKIEQIINPFTSEESRQAGLLSPEGTARPDNLAHDDWAETLFDAAYKGWSDVIRADYANKTADIYRNLPADWTAGQRIEYASRFFDADGKFHWDYKEATQGYLPDNLAVPTVGKDGRTNDAFDTIIDDYHYEDADGQRLYRGDDGKYYYGNGDEYKGDKASQVYNLTPEQYLELWIDPEHNMRGGVPGALSTKDGEGYRGLENLPEEVFAIIATNHIAAENFEEIFNGTDEEYNRLVDLFMGGMPALQSMVDNGMVTMEDIIRFFFKTPKSQAGKKSYGGYGGYGGRYYGGGGGYRGGGSSTYRPNPTTTNQKQSRIYNIMKNWSF